MMRALGLAIRAAIWIFLVVMVLGIVVFGLLALFTKSGY
jgi:hypothetical protein